MDESSALALFFLQIWRLFTLDSPFFGLKVYQIVLGLFVAELGIGALGDSFLGLFNTSSPSSESRIDDFNRSMNRRRSYMYNKFGYWSRK